MESIGKRIKSKRKELNLTIKQVHEISGLSIGNISDMENDKYAPSTSSLIPLSKVLQCSIDWIITGSNYQNEIREIEIENTTKFSEIENDIVNMFRQLDERDKEDVFDSIKLKYDRSVKKGKSTSLYSTYTEENKNDTKSDTNCNDSGIA